MGTYHKLPTKAAKLRFMQEALATDDRWLLRGLLAILRNQTEDEQRSEATTEHNGIGFTGIDAKYLTSIAHQIINRGVVHALRDPNSKLNLEMFLSAKQIPFVKKKMQKYAKQLCKVADEAAPTSK